jgi:predicted nucleic acid-binding Zn ribbon protein
MSTWQPSTPPAGEQEPRKLGQLLDRASRRLGGPSSTTASTLFAHWDEVVGPDIAGHARPVSLHDGVLVLAVDHPAWATQLRYMTADLLARIAAATTPTADRPEVTEIHVRVVGQPRPDSPFRRGRKTPS